ncbi:MAG: hypothetical protein JXA89_12670 [Anaerolineae bacterium]|nr:hypothetical protein [Anaerolineae bacterium]
MKKRAVLLVTLALLLVGCGGSGPKAKITSVETVDTINASGVFYKFEGKDNIQIVLEFTFDESVAPDLDPTSDDYRKELYSLLAAGAHFYHDGQEVERTWGYWPQEVGGNYAKELSLFYVVPSSRSAESLRFVYDGEVLGEEASGIDTVIKPD